MIQGCLCNSFAKFILLISFFILCKSGRQKETNVQNSIDFPWGKRGQLYLRSRTHCFLWVFTQKILWFFLRKVVLWFYVFEMFSHGLSPYDLLSSFLLLENRLLYPIRKYYHKVSKIWGFDELFRWKRFFTPIIFLRWTRLSSGFLTFTTSCFSLIIFLVLEVSSLCVETSASTNFSPRKNFVLSWFHSRSCFFFSLHSVKCVLFCKDTLLGCNSTDLSLFQPLITNY